MKASSVVPGDDNILSLLDCGMGDKFNDVFSLRHVFTPHLHRILPESPGSAPEG